jgi:hypothetical protein
MSGGARRLSFCVDSGDGYSTTKTTPQSNGRELKALEADPEYAAARQRESRGFGLTSLPIEPGKHPVGHAVAQDHHHEQA